MKVVNDFMSDLITAASFYCRVDPTLFEWLDSRLQFVGGAGVWVSVIVFSMTALLFAALSVRTLGNNGNGQVVLSATIGCLLAVQVMFTHPELFAQFCIMAFVTSRLLTAITVIKLGCMVARSPWRGIGILVSGYILTVFLVHIQLILLASVVDSLLLATLLYNSSSVTFKHHDDSATEKGVTTAIRLAGTVSILIGVLLPARYTSPTLTFDAGPLWVLDWIQMPCFVVTVIVATLLAQRQGMHLPSVTSPRSP